jgi:hypothetical protein
MFTRYGEIWQRGPLMVHPDTVIPTPHVFGLLYCQNEVRF